MSIILPRRRSSPRILALVGAVGLAASVSHAQTVWTGSVSNSWNNISNWTAGLPGVGLSAQLNGPPIAQTTGSVSTQDLTITSPAAGILINSGSTLTVQGSSVMNVGSIAVNPSGGASDATIFFNSLATTLSGGGSIVLNEFGAGVATDAGINATAGNIVTNASNHTIRGNGYINASIDNQGTIAADVAARGLNLAANPKSNSGLIVASNGGSIDVNSIAVTQTSTGVIRAVGAGSVAEANGTIIGGKLEGVGGGIARTGGTLTLDNVTTNGEVHVISGHVMPVLNAMNNTGTITVNPSGGASDATISFNSPAITLAGGGTIVLNPIGGGFATDAGIITSVGTNVVTNPVGATIRGNGYITANIANAGLITCDIPARGLSLTGNPKSNSGEIIAQNGGVVGGNVTITQTSTGVFRATGAGSVVQIGPGAIIGGTWEGIGGGIAQTTGSTTLDAVTLNGEVHVNSGHTANLDTSLTNNATVIVNPTGGASNATLVLLNSLAIGGSGAILFNGVGSLNDASILGGSAITLTNSQSHTLGGNGEINVTLTNNGILSPGRPSPADQTQTLSRGSDTTCTATSVVKIDIEGTAAGQFDRVASSNNQADFVCDGTLEVSHINGFIGASFGTTFDVITAISPAVITGSFDTLVLPTLPNFDRYVIDYLPQAVRLRVTCYADCDGSGALNIFDYICFGQAFAAGQPYADCDGGGALNIFDYICFGNKYTAGCP